MTSGLVTAAGPEARLSCIWTQKERRSATSNDCSESSVSSSHQRGLMFGFVHQPTAIFRLLGVTPVAASNTDITTAGARYATKTSSTGSLNSPKPCRIFADELPGI